MLTTDDCGPTCLCSHACLHCAAQQNLMARQLDTQRGVNKG